MEDTIIEDVLKTAEASFAKKDFNSALETLKAHENEVPQGLWHYNIGTVYAGLGEYALARFHFLSAENLGFVSKEVSRNLEIVETKLEIPRLEKSLSWSDHIVKGSLYASEGILTSLAFLILVLGIFSLRQNRSFIRVGITTLIVVIVLTFNWWVQSWPRVIVETPQVIYDGPSAIFATRDELPVGVMIIASPEENWIRIRYPSRFQGWIKNAGLKELK